MPSLYAFVVLLLGVLALAGVLTAAAFSFAPVTRSRLERFAVNQALVVTVDNGPTLIRYLATTRRWRGALLTLTVAGSTLVHLVTRGGLNVSGVWAFAGWFVGAVIAEWRVDTRTGGPRAAASLRRRRFTDYVPGRVLSLLAVLWTGVLGLAVAGVVEASDARLLRAATPAAVLVVGATVWLVGRQILRRAQPMAAEDVLAADQAMRGRSLNVLAGAALAIGGFLGAASASELARGADSSVVLAHLVGYLALPALGVLVAGWPRLRPVVVPVSGLRRALR